MNGSWSSPTDASWSSPSSSKPKLGNSQRGDEENKFFSLVVDSGAIIKHSGFSTLHNAASKYFTTQGVIDEIRDSKARHHLDSLPFQLIVRDPTAEGLQKVVEFSKKTGDYASLSIVDLNVLALQYDLEKEGCGSMDHIRVEPKRMVGNGKVIKLKRDKTDDSSTVAFDDHSISIESVVEDETTSFFEPSQSEMKINEEVETRSSDPKEPANVKPKSNISWAALVNPVVTSSNLTVTMSQNSDDGITKSMESMNLNIAKSMLNTLHEEKNEDNDCGGSGGGGQFSDADDDESIEIPHNVQDENSDSDDGDEYASIGSDFSDEECDVYILDPDEVEDRKRQKEASMANQECREKISSFEKDEILKELEMEFPSLTAASTVPYEGSDDECDKNHNSKKTHLDQDERLKKAAEEEKKRKQASLQPLSKSGKLYNSFGKYKKLVSKSGVEVASKEKKNIIENENQIDQTFKFLETKEKQSSKDDQYKKVTQSRVIGGAAAMSGQSNEVDDDGEGWVTCAKDIVAMKATGTLNPFIPEPKSHQASKPQENLPLKQCRTACATTDFAMQNVILQMNLELLTVDGVRVRKLKSWVQRCSTCSEVYTAVDSARLFCSKCGSSSIQRIAASVDGKTGRLKLHLKKNYQHRIRGTQYALPKPGKQNRFMGDLILSEDQLMYGAISQRVKQVKSKNMKAAQSIFGADIASTVGCNADLSKLGDIRVGFGRKNPNATKFGRERRGKKKKSSDKVCGLRRY